MKKLALAVIFSCALTANSHNALALLPADSAKANHNRLSNDHELGKKIDDYLTRITGFGYSGAMLVAKDGKIILRKGYGFADREKKILNTPETVFDIGSLSKQFTATAILKLEMAGKLKVTDPVSKYLPDVPADKAKITIHQILSHTSGLVRDFNMPHEVTRDQVVEHTLAAPLLFEPGSRFEYSNMGYSLLAAVVELVSGVPFRQYLKKNLFLPADMQSTGFWGNLAPPVKPELIARSYDDFARAGWPLDWSGTTWKHLGASGVTSTVVDLYKWQLALKGEGVLSREAREKMWRTILNNYGYGWNIEKTPRGTTVIWHGGDSDGFGSILSWYGDENVVMIGLCNVRHDWYPTRIKADEIVPKIIFGENYIAPPAFIAADPKMLKRVVGTYQLASGAKLIVRMEEGQLEIGAKGQDAVDILREADEKELQRRAHLTATTKNILNAYLAGDMTPLNEVGASDPDFQKAIGDEIKELGQGKGALKSFDVLGTCEAGQYSPKVHNTIVQLNYENGHGYYKFRWTPKILQGTYVKSATLSAVTPLQAQSASSFVGWNIMSWKPTNGFRVSFKLVGGAVTELSLHRDKQQWSARRVN